MAITQRQERQFTEQEVRRILQRAGELQAARVSGGGDSGAAGTTLTQLQQAASEIGIDPALIEQAANEAAEEEPAGIGVRLLGGPWRVDSERFVRGAVTEESWSYLVEEIRAATGRVGFPKAVGRGFEFLSHQPDPLHIALTPYGENTRLRVTARFGQWGGLFYTLFPILVFILTLMGCLLFGKSPLMTPGLFAALVTGLPAAALLSSRAAFGRLCARKRRQTRQLMARLEQRIAQPLPETVLQVSAAQEVTEAAPVRSVMTPATEEPALLLQQNRPLL